MFLNPFLFLIIYVTSKIVAKDIHIPLCAAWNTTGTVIIGSEDGQSGTNETMLNEPTAIVAVGENNILYVVDSKNNRLMKYEHGSDIGEQVNISDGTLNDPRDIAIDESGGIYISEAGNNQVVRWTFDPPSTETLMKILSPSGIYLNEATNKLYVLGQLGTDYHVVMRYDFNSTESEKVIGKKHPGGPDHSSSSLYTPIGIYVDREQQIYVAESGSNRITKWKTKAKSGTKFASTGNCGIELTDLCSPTSFILNDTNTMYIADKTRILRWTQDVSERACLLGCNITIGNQTFHQPIQPYDITFDSNHHLLVVEKDMHRIKRFNFYFNQTCMLKYCQAPIISINDYSSNHNRSQLMKFFINAKLDCYIWTNTTIQCTVLACYPGDRSCIQTAKLNTLVNSFVKQVNSDSFTMEIPPFALPVGTYRFSCTITMKLVPKRKSTIEYNLKIIRSPITITLLPLGKSKMTLGYQQQHTFSPKISPNDTDPQSMLFVYYCRKYPNFSYTTVKGVRLNIDEDSENPTSSTCFNLKVLPQSFIYENDTSHSSLTIMSGSLQINQIYEFYVELYDNEKLVDKSDVVLVEIQSEDSIVVEISPVFNNLILDNDYQLLNPSTQLQLQSFSSNTSIEWEIYTGTMISDSIIEWKEFNVNYTNYTNESSNQWFYGINSSRLTVTKDVFLSNEEINYWQFVANYISKDGSGSGSVQLKTNHPPVQQYCSIDPTNGSTNQFFTVICANWTDLDGIEDYFLHVLSSKPDIIMSIAHSSQPIFNVHLPSGDPKLDYELNLIVHVQDKLGAWTESNVTTVTVKPDEQFVSETLNFTEDLVFNGDQNRNQLITSFSTILNQIASDDQTALIRNREVQISDLIISTFETIRAESPSGNKTNASLIFIKSLNRRSIIREYFLNFYENISIPTIIEEIIILSSTINQLTDTTSEWTQTSLSIASKLCNLLSKALYDLSSSITIEQVLLGVQYLAPCTSNIFTGVNGPLQHRGFIFDRNLDKDFLPSNEIDYNNDYYEYMDYESMETEIPYCNQSQLKKNRVCREDIIDENNSTTSIFHNNPEFYNQKVLATRLGLEIRETMLYLAKSIRRHLNVFQDLSILAPVFRMFVEQIYQKDIEDKFIDLNTSNASIYLPKNLAFISSDLLGIQATLLPLAPAGGDVGVSLSTALTLSVFDDNDQELEINTTNNLPIEMFIPRDINLPIPRFVEENMTILIPPRRGILKINRQFFIYYVNITQDNPNLTISIHFELKPIERNISYFVIYKLDLVPAYNSTHQSFDGAVMFCSETLTDEMNYYKYYIDNIKTAGHKSLLIGIRELGENDQCSIDILPLITDQPYGFLYNYFLRIYSSGCYYLSERGYWKSDGMKVGNKTNFEYTHCYSNHT